MLPSLPLYSFTRPSLLHRRNTAAVTPPPTEEERFQANQAFCNEVENRLRTRRQTGQRRLKAHNPFAFFYWRTGPKHHENGKPYAQINLSVDQTLPGNSFAPPKNPRTPRRRIDSSKRDPEISRGEFYRQMARERPVTRTVSHNGVTVQIREGVGPLGEESQFSDDLQAICKWFAKQLRPLKRTLPPDFNKENWCVIDISANAGSCCKGGCASCVVNNKKLKFFEITNVPGHDRFRNLYPNEKNFFSRFKSIKIPFRELLTRIR